MLLKTRESHAAILEQSAQLARTQGHHKEAVDAYRKAAVLMAHRPERQTALSAEADAILSGLAQRLRIRAEASRQQGLLGLAWAQAKASALLGAAPARGELPDLEPLLRFTVALELDGDPSLLGRVRGPLRQGLARYGGSGYVVLADGSTQRGQASLHVHIDPAVFRTEQGQVKTLSKSYVQRIDTVPNPEWQRLQTEVGNLGRQLQSFDAQLTTQRGRLVLLRSNLADAKAEFDAVRATQRDYETKLQELEGRAKEAQQQVSQLKRDLDAEVEAIRALDQRLAVTPEGEPRNQLLAQRTARQQRAQQVPRRVQLRVRGGARPHPPPAAPPLPHPDSRRST